MKKGFIFLTLFLLISAAVYFSIFNRQGNTHISAFFKPTPTATPTLTPSPKSTPTGGPSPTLLPRTKTVKIALLGDSMIQTAATAGPLKKYLEDSYTDYNVAIVNLGVGATTIESGAARVESAIAQKPDIIIVESFAYNHLSKDDAGLSRHRQLLSQIVEKLKSAGISKIIILATIAPVQTYAMDAPASKEWTLDFRKEEADWIKKYLENAISFANSNNLILVDAYHSSIEKDGYGNPAFVNPEDDIHPNFPGHQFVLRLIASKIKALNWIK